jgi:hypothetical protein
VSTTSPLVQVVDGVPHEVGHRGQPVGQALALPLGDGGQRRRHGGQPRRQAVGDGHVGQRGEQPGHWCQEQAADGEVEEPTLGLPGPHLDLVLDDPPGDPVGPAQTPVRHGPGPGEDVLGLGQEPLLGGPAVVGEPIIVAGQAHEAGAEREAVQGQPEQLVGEIGDRWHVVPPK